MDMLSEENLLAKTILYLDDEESNLIDAEEIFIKEGVTLQITNSVSSAKERALKNELDVFICDLRLDKISSLEKGNSILKFIRERNKDIFLALYTAYIKELSKEEIKTLKSYNINVYDKTSTDVFLLNLQHDYKIFKNHQTTSLATEKFDLTPDIRRDVIKHLNNISNPNIRVPIPGAKDVTVKELILEVENNSEIGRTFMKEWYETLILVYQLRKIK